MGGGDLTSPSPVDSARPPARRRSLVGAEVLRIRRRQGLMVALVLLAFGPLLAVGGFAASRHATNPALVGRPGGATAITVLGIVLVEFGTIAGMLVGAFAGTADLSSGILRALITTGRQRWMLFLARVPAVLVVVAPTIVVAYTAICIYSVALSYGLREDSVAEMALIGAWILLNVCVWSVVALCFATLVGSRSVTVGLLLGLNLIGGAILSNPSAAYPGLREAIFFVTLTYVAPSGLFDGLRYGVNEAPWVSALVIVGWLVGMLALAARRAVTQDV